MKVGYLLPEIGEGVWESGMVRSGGISDELNRGFLTLATGPEAVQRMPWRASYVMEEKAGRLPRRDELAKLKQP